MSFVPAPQLAGRSLYWLALATGVTFAVAGLTQLKAIDASDGVRILAAVVGLALVLAGASKVLRLAPPACFAAACLLVAALTGALWPLLATLLIGFSAALLGQRVLALLGCSEELRPGVTPLLVGAGVQGTLLGLLAHFPVAYAGTYSVFVLLPLLFERRRLVDWWLVAWRVCRLSDAPADRVTRLAEPLIAGLALVYFTAALMPEVGHDALAMHLFVPAQLAFRHIWPFDVEKYVWAVMPMLGDWLLALAYVLAGETAARLLTVGFIFVLACLVAELVRWARGTEASARLAVLLLLSTPLAYTEGSSVFIESSWASFLIVGVLMYFRALSQPSRHCGIMLAGLFLGLALASKSVTLTILPVLLAGLALRYRVLASASFRHRLAGGLVLFLLLGGIPFLTAWLKTGNPVFPFFNAVFRSEFYPAVNFESASLFGKGVPWDILYSVTFDSGRFLEAKPGAAGFQWLILLVPALLLGVFDRNWRVLAVLGVGILAILAVFQSVSYLRYVFPSFALVAAGIAATAAPGRISLHLAIGVVCTLNLFFFRSGTYYGAITAQPLLGAIERSDYLLAHSPVRKAVDLVNSMNTARSPVAFLAPPLAAGLQADALYANWYNVRFQGRINEAASAPALASTLNDADVRFVILDTSWGSPEKRRLIEAVTESIADYGGVSVRSLRKEFSFRTEMLQNTTFETTAGWSGDEVGRPRDGRGVAVSVASPLFQAVPVEGGARYRNSVTAQCADKPATGRVQVNWLNAGSVFIKADIKVFDCGQNEETHEMEIRAPLKAATAIVYATSHLADPVVVTNVSLRR